MTNKKCLNCEAKLIDKFCHGCGQKSDTQRITFKNFIFHDLLHGIFHIEKGMLFTAKQALIRPGNAALDYISGKRKRYYNVFYFIIITFGLILFFRHFLDQLYTTQEGFNIPNKAYINEASKKLDDIFSQKSKIIVLLFVPLAALNSHLIFRRKKLNFSEHTIIAGMILLAMLLMSLAGNLFFYFELIFPFSNTFSSIISWIVTVFVILHIGYGYYNAFSRDFSKIGISYRIVLFYALLCIEILILFLIVFGFISKWKFGNVTVSPF